jgi:hypothetical protein
LGGRHDGGVVESLDLSLNHDYGGSAKERAPYEAGAPRGFPETRPGFQPGQIIKVDGCRGSLEVTVVLNDGRARFAILDAHETRHAAILGKEAAEDSLREFERTGRIDLSKRRPQ